MAEPKDFKNGQGQWQEIRITKPGFVDEYGEKKGKDKIFPVILYNNDISHHNLMPQRGKKVDVEAYLNSNEYRTEKGLAYNLSLKLKSIKVQQEGRPQNG